MPLIRIKHIDTYDILDNKIIINPVSINGVMKNITNKQIKKMMGKHYNIVRESCMINKVKRKKLRDEILGRLTLKPITPTSYNTIVRFVKGENKFIVNIPYCKDKEQYRYLNTLREFLVEAREYPDVIIAIPLYGDSFGKLKKNVVDIIKESNYPAYIDLYVDDKTKDMALNRL